MPEIGSLTQTRPVEVEIVLPHGETVNLTFDSSAITPRWMNKAQRQLETGDVLTFPQALAEVIVAWDVTDEGQPFPPTAENLERFTMVALGSLFERIAEASVPSSAEGNASGTPSSTPSTDYTPPVPTPQNGPVTSPSPVPSASPSPT